MSLKFRFRFSRESEPTPRTPEQRAAGSLLADIAKDYEALRKEGVVRQLEPIDLERIRRLCIEIAVTKRTF